MNVKTATCHECGKLLDSPDPFLCRECANHTNGEHTASPRTAHCVLCLVDAEAQVLADMDEAYGVGS